MKISQQYQTILKHKKAPTLKMANFFYIPQILIPIETLLYLHKVFFTSFVLRNHANFRQKKSNQMYERKIMKISIQPAKI